MIIDIKKPAFVLVITFLFITFFKEESTEFLAGYLFAFIVTIVTSIFSEPKNE